METEENKTMTLCRVCLLQRQSTMLIFEILNNNLISETVLDFLYIKVLEDDCYPTSVCTDCLETMKNIQAFQKKCLLALTYFENELKNQRKHLDFNDLYPPDEQKITAVKEENIENNHFKEITLSDQELDSIDVKETISINLEKSTKRHKKDNSNEIYSCQECLITFKNEKLLKGHNNRIHNANRTKTTCELCGKAVFNLNIHKKTIHNPMKFDCNQCEKTFKGKHTLKLHIDYVHVNPNQIRKALCQLCGSGFRNNSELNKHTQQRHSDLKNYKCGFCCRSFKTSSQCRFHERRAHSNERSFKCRFCSNSFLLRRTLDNHERIHTGEKPFVCDFCSKAFTQKSTMMTHVKLIHKKEKI